MPNLNDLEVGAMFWATPDPLAAIREAKSLGVRCGQLGIPGDLPLRGSAAAWKTALKDEGFTVVTAFCAYNGESYADVPTVEKTVGFIPRATREEREARTIEVSDFAAAIGVGSIGCHAGFVPEDSNHPDYIAVRDLIRRDRERAEKVASMQSLVNEAREAGPGEHDMQSLLKEARRRLGQNGL